MLNVTSWITFQLKPTKPFFSELGPLELRIRKIIVIAVKAKVERGGLLQEWKITILYALRNVRDTLPLKLREPIKAGVIFIFFLHNRVK